MMPKQKGRYSRLAKKNKIYVFSANGKFYKRIDCPIQQAVSVAFNSEEDLVVLTQTGTLYIVDVVVNKIKDQKELGMDVIDSIFD